MDTTRILIVEDESIIAMDLARRLARMGYAIAAVTAAGADAVLLAAELRPDLVLMDIVLKGDMDGVEAAGQIRQRSDIPVVYLTAYSDEETWQRAKTAEPYGYILKPFEDRELRTIIEIAIYKHRMEAAMRRSEERFRSLIENAADILMIVDGESTIRYVSPSARRVIGYEASEMLGKDCFAFTHPEDTPRVASSFAGTVHRPGVSEPVEMRVRHRDGSWRIMEGIATNLLDEPAVQGVMIIARDLTGRRQTEAELQQRNRELAVLIEQLHTRNEELDAFAHIVAHDLKSPLSLILICADLLRAGTGAAGERDAVLNDLERITHKMDSIIEELLLLSQLGRMEVERGSLDMERIVSEVLRRLAHLIEAHHAEVRLPASWPAALGYAPWVEEVWVNYLSNAVQYGGRPPRIELGAEAPPGAPPRFWVRDNGPGLAPEDQARLFAPFTRLDRMHSQGHGLGLSITKRIIEKLGGQVGVESQPGCGSTFYFTLAGPTTEDQAAGEASRPDARTTSESLTRS